MEFAKKIWVWFLGLIGSGREESPAAVAVPPAAETQAQTATDTMVPEPPQEEESPDEKPADTVTAELQEAEVSDQTTTDDMKTEPQAPEIDPRSVRPDPKNRNYTIPRTYGVYRITAVKRGGASRVFRYGNHPVRLKELERQFGAVELVALYGERDFAVERAKREEDAV